MVCDIKRILEIRHKKALYPGIQGFLKNAELPKEAWQIKRGI